MKLAAAPWYKEVSEILKELISRFGCSSDSDLGASEIDFGLSTSEREDSQSDSKASSYFSSSMTSSLTGVLATDAVDASDAAYFYCCASWHF